MKKSLFLLALAISFVTYSNAQKMGWSELGDLKQNKFIGNLLTRGGKVYASGYLLDSSGNNAVMVWDGSKWTQLGSLGSKGTIIAMCFDKKGNLYVGGQFTNSGGSEYVAKWDGSSWTELKGTNSLDANRDIQSICIDKAGNIYAAGYFTDANKKCYVAKFDGKSWTDLGSSGSALSATTGAIMCMNIDTADNIYVGGTFTNSNGKNYVAKWNGSKWAEMGTGSNALNANATISAMCMDSKGHMFVSGDFTGATGRVYAAYWDGSKWDSISHSNVIGNIYRIKADSLDNIYIAGSFLNASGNTFVAKWDGTSISELGGINSLQGNSDIDAIAIDGQGNVYAGGDFTDASNNHYVARYGEIITGIDNPVENDMHVSLFPNPANDKIYIKLDESEIPPLKGAGGMFTSFATITDLSGREILSQVISSSQTSIDISSCAKGMYLLRIQDGNSIYTAKFSKQ